MRLGLVAVLVLLSSTSSGLAASLNTSDAPHCVARLSEQIVAGDLRSLQAKLPDLRAQSKQTGQRLALCLDSPGGSLLEATRIAAFIETNRIGTVVDDGAVCLSACSVIFMLGAQDQPGTSLTVDIGENRVLLEFSRRLHVNGSLGFHRPDFSLADGTYTAQDVKQSFDLAILASLEFLKIANRWKISEGAPAMKADLIEALLSHEGQDFFYIDTVDKAGRWDIEVFGYDAPDRLSAREAMNACDNLSNWTTGLAAIPVQNADTETLKRFTTRYAAWSQDGGDPSLVYTPVYSLSGRDAFFHADGAAGERYCQVSFDPWTHRNGTQNLTVSACGGDSILGTSFFEYCGPEDVSPEMAFYDALPAFPSDTRLSDLPAVAHAISAQADEIETSLMPAAGLSCGIPEDHQIAVVAPEGHVLLREFDSPSATPLARAENFTILQRGSNTGVLVGTPAQRDTCFEACTAPTKDLPDSERQEIFDQTNACFNEGIVWWSIRLRDGSDGWASARYLR